ncbi:hypothetical protein M0R45_006053 [Rubus argutus]|uniref:Transmembrane protein n=1 Tax=Rubus argutus TaxID=59490 RepID=A0AAW1YPD6_RUBAR
MVGMELKWIDGWEYRHWLVVVGVRFCHGEVQSTGWFWDMMVAAALMMRWWNGLISGHGEDGIGKVSFGLSGGDCDSRWIG